MLSWARSNCAVSPSCPVTIHQLVYSLTNHVLFLCTEIQNFAVRVRIKFGATYKASRATFAVDLHTCVLKLFVEPIVVTNNHLDIIRLSIVMMT